ncbi:MAG: peptidase S8 [Caldilinea sp. CFX5]|nr:peptidase S8 [Caldilinea sp. CFX5]
MPVLAKKINLLFLVLIQIFALSGWHLQHSPVAAAAPADTSALIEQMVLVHFAPTATDSDRAATIGAMQGELVEWLPQIQVAKVRLVANNETEQTLLKGNAADVAQRRLQTTGRSLAATAYVENDVVVEGAYLPSDPDVANPSRTYPLTVTHTIEGWDYTRGDSSIIIAVLDSGINLSHPEFSGRLLPGYDFINNDADPTDDHGHGSHTAGIIGAGIDNGVGMVGVCPQCTLLPVKVLNFNNAGTWSSVAQGIIFATDQGARVINLSLGASVSSKTLEAAVSYAVERNVLIVAAAGNMGTDRKFYPAALDNVLAVSATDANDQRWALSNMGDHIDLAAPGHAVYSTYYDLQNYYSGYNYMSGTSMAAPHVAGLAGLLLSQKPTRTPTDLYNIMTKTADRSTSATRDAYFGYGRINVVRALAYEAPAPPTAVAGGEQTPPAEQPAANDETNAGNGPIAHALYLPLLFRP